MVEAEPAPGEQRGLPQTLDSEQGPGRRRLVVVWSGGLALAAAVWTYGLGSPTTALHPQPSRPPNLTLLILSLVAALVLVAVWGARWGHTAQGRVPVRAIRRWAFIGGGT